jgi:hypothetical protein
MLSCSTRGDDLNRKSTLRYPESCDGPNDAKDSIKCTDLNIVDARLGLASNTHETKDFLLELVQNVLPRYFVSKS